MNERAEMYAELQQSTAKMLGYVEPLTPQQKLRVDLAASLRMEIDRITRLQLAGSEINLRDLTNASEALENLLRPSAVAAVHSYGTVAPDKLKALLTTTFAAQSGPDADILAREEMAAVAAAFPPPPAITSEQTNNKQPAPTRSTSRTL
jgi:hypothetical protein